MILADVIKAVESSGNAHAVKFEPVLFASDPQWVARQEGIIAKRNSCDLVTAKQIAVTSYGFYQLLGANIYALGFPYDYFAFVASDQSAVFAKFVATGGFDPKEDVSGWSLVEFESFARFYNGPGEVDFYVADMKKAAGVS